MGAGECQTKNVNDYDDEVRAVICSILGETHLSQAYLYPLISSWWPLEPDAIVPFPILNDSFLILSLIIFSIFACIYCS